MFHEQGCPDSGAARSDNAQGHQQERPIELALGGLGLRIRLNNHGLQGRALENGHIAGLVQGDPADRAAIVGGHGIALDVTAGCGAGIGGYGCVPVANGVSVQVGGVVRLPADVLEGQGAAAVLDALGDIGGVLAGKIGVASGGGDFLDRKSVV